MLIQEQSCVVWSKGVFEMEQATKFFQDFNTGLEEVVSICDEIKGWFSNVDFPNLDEPKARDFLSKQFAKEDEYLSVTESSLWFESKENLGLTWRYYSENNEYVFIVNGYYFDDNEVLKSKFYASEGWKVIPCI